MAKRIDPKRSKAAKKGAAKRKGKKIDPATKKKIAKALERFHKTGRRKIKKRR